MEMTEHQGEQREPDDRENDDEQEDRQCQAHYLLISLSRVFARCLAWNS